MRFGRSLRAALAAALLITGTAAPAYEEQDAPSAEAMAFDLLIIRPIGLVASVAGIGLFVLSLPFDAIQGNFRDPANRLVVEPLKFTFTRDLGVMD